MNVVKPSASPPRARRVPNFRLRTDPQRLIAAALEEFSSTSFDKTNVVSITRRLGLSKAALYVHFSSKRAIFDRMIEEFCLVGELDDQDIGGSIERSLGSDPSIKILRVVVREWPTMPRIGAQYLHALSTRLAKQKCVPDLDTARRLATAALAPVMVGLLFRVDFPTNVPGPA